MIRFSASLVVVAIGLLVGGVVTSKLVLVYLAIAVSVTALVALGVGVVLKRAELFGEPAPGLAQPGFGSQAAAGEPGIAGQQGLAGQRFAGQQAPAGGGMPAGAAGQGYPPPPSSQPRVDVLPPAAEPAGAAAPANWFDRMPKPASPDEDVPAEPPTRVEGPVPAEPPTRVESAVAATRAEPVIPAGPAGKTGKAAARLADDDTAAVSPAAVSPKPGEADGKAGGPPADDHAAGGGAPASEDADREGAPADASAQATPAEAAAPEAAPSAGGGRARNVPGGKRTSQQVTVVPGVPRYHRANCILIRFMGDDDLQRMSLAAATDAGCTPCRACQPDIDGSEAAAD